ncbi:nitrate- and nitrite sensing domain-containing protein [Nonomuraea sp. NPDC046570]|uniref:sensor histidine kinase n=1 Tax=Nonomuraea sp. NPDC046570 TaxID=3155255 RepID=UPI0033D28252
MALILIPTVVGVLLAGIQLADSIGTSAEYRRLTQIAELEQRLGALTHELGKERSLTAWYIADRRRDGRMAQLRDQRDIVDAAKKRVLDSTAAIDESHSARVRGEVSEMVRWLNGLKGLRESIVGDSVPARASVRTYSSMIDVMEGLQNELGSSSNDDRLLGDSTALGALHRTKEEVSRQQVILVVALIEKALDYDDLSDFLGSWNRQQTELATFEREAGSADSAYYRASIKGREIDRADAMRQRALAQMREYKRIRDLDVTSRRDLTLWYESTTKTVDAMRKVEDKLATSIVAQTRVLSDTEQRNAIISGALILVLLALVLVITTRVAGSLVRPLRRLRAEALEIAGTRLPDTVRALRESGDGAAIPEVASIGVHTRDEIGEVARAFDEVHREAVRLAGDEARLRANVNSMFVNLSRRSQTLVERQLSLIEGLENGEEDENRLASLFRLDHLATRMRRNSENLLVLAGQEAARKWSQPVQLVDIARASLSEVENYERVVIQVPTGVMIAGPAVTDAVHLLAELIENAISFSPRETKVTVTSHRTEGGVLITVSDLGIGMTGEELGQANWRLANPPVVDVAVSRRMGLFVVGRLALRHGIQVQLRAQEASGLAAMVMMPDTLVTTPGAPQTAAGFAGAGQAGGFGGQPNAYGSQPTFDPQQIFDSYSTFDAPVHAAPVPVYGMDTPDVRGFDEPLHTPWPGNMPPPEGGWPSFGDDPRDGVFGERREESQWPPAPGPEEGQWSAAPEENKWSAPEENTWSPPEESKWPPAAEENQWRAAPAVPDAPVFDAFGRSAVEADMTGPLPVVRNSPMEDESEEFLPIFSSVGSDWFRRPDPEAQPEPEPEPEGLRPARMTDLPEAAPAPRAEPPQRSPLPQRRPGGSTPPTWSSPADTGWQAAQAAADPAMGGVTASGLPRRVPKANLVPGTAGANEPAATPEPMPPISPERVRSRLSSFQQGVRQGRAFTRGDEDMKEDDK